MYTETIAAIATALSDSGISIIRVSGPDAITAVDQIFMTKGRKHILQKVSSHTIHYGLVYEQDKPVDEVMVSVMRAPRSYTAEDVVEIHCHGGILITNRILELVIETGVRLALPGEFTKRAFLNGRIDLSRAEAVMDLIQSTNEFAMRSSFSQLRGSVFSVIKELREKILYEIAFIESALDDPEHIDMDGHGEALSQVLNELSFTLKKLIDSAKDGKVMKDGIGTVILGKPNAGKSSLLNALSGGERAIVTDIAGTTRDILEETVRLKNICLCIKDTAGIRHTEDIVEKIGVERAIQSAKEADLILYVVDASVPWDDNDFEILSFIREKNCLIILNKTDLPSVITEDIIYETTENRYPVIKMSLTQQSGMEELEEAIRDLFFHGKISFENEVYITNMRHKEALQEAYESILMVIESVSKKLPEDFYSIDLMNAYSRLGHIIGEEVGEDLVNEIFSRFCMGK
ncbi:MAG: tRNA uridine-5-carboxymethylaminomethyl(34) synthesis GTPase MnmE [Lachnospiraceae bacterium]|nr:tRNA uridine-5-carboxymethylaminomethyl(34) synthesis GTPase MnmE [Lachnospiraceae bacterium]